jgi:dihydroneopterin aldolase / 2-amino-4-hydroxy-6-hydroxymethyldihydropteridine diphosphokinase
MIECYIGIGSNLGDRNNNIDKAIKMIGIEEKVIAISGVIETKPMYYNNQNDFLNCVISIYTMKPPSNLLRHLKGIESKLRRKETVKYGPRIIDLDILFYGDNIIKEDGLIIPHPLIMEREFVLKPFSEINPEFVHPENGKTIKVLLEELQSKEI